MRKLADAIRKHRDPEFATRFRYNWKNYARPEQLLPVGDRWNIWLYCAGRGAGKTRSGAQGVIEWAQSGYYPIIHLVGATAADVRDVMVNGPSGILACSPPWFRPVYTPSTRSLTWPNHTKALLFSAEEPNRLRGPQCHAAWADEIAAWKYDETWSMLMFGLRLGRHPRCIATTTPRPTPLIRDLVEREGKDVVISRGNTYDNQVNLAETFLSQILAKYEGTRLGKQEIYAELLLDTPGALWTAEMLERAYSRTAPNDLDRIVVAIDPAVTKEESSDETGIIVAGAKSVMDVKMAYVLDDLTMKGTPMEWCRAAVSAYRHHGADRIVAEVNNGGDLVETVLRQVDPNVPFRAVRASHGKRIRAEPVSALYEQARVKHIGRFGKLEDQMRTFNPEEVKKSPDRVDALVWALTELIVAPLDPGIFVL